MAMTAEQKDSILEKYEALRETEMTDAQRFSIIAENLDIGSNTVRRVVKGLDSYDRPIGAAMPVPETSADYEVERDALSALENVRGTTTLYDADGKIRLKWVKASADKDRLKPEDWIAAFASDLPKASPVPPKNYHANDLLAVYPMGDPHIGMLAHAEEAGADFDIKIAERHLCGAVDRLVRTAPPSRQAVIANLGDFFHADNTLNETMRSKHPLDTDSRWSKVLIAGVRIMKQCIASALDHHEHVKVINLQGNHDDHSSMFLAVALAEYYSEEPRVEIPVTPAVKQYHHFGRNLIGFYHGHDIKQPDLALNMPVDQPVAWGESDHRYWYCGHVHHDSKKEYQSVIVETFRTLAPKDAWAASRGYHAGRDMKCIVLHRTRGEVERHRVSAAMIDEEGL